MSTRRLSQGENLAQLLGGRRVSAILPPIDLTLQSHTTQHNQTIRSDSDNHDGINTSSPEKAAYALLYAAFADGINFSCITPNVPSMCMPGMHSDSFPSIEPWMGMASAQYFLLGSVSIGTVFSGFFFGWLSSRVGYRISFAILALGSVVFSIIRYFVRGSYWWFTAMSFIYSFFGGIGAVGNGYIGFLFNDRNKTDIHFGYLLATTLLSSTLGGLLTLLFPSDLFLPLIPAAAISFSAFIVVYLYVSEPMFDDVIDSQQSEIERGTEKIDASENEDEVVLQFDELKKFGDEKPDQLDAPQQLDWLLFTNIVVGTLVDITGSLGIAPLAFSPVLFTKFYLDFEMQNSKRGMSENQYRMLYSLVALMVIPAIMMTPYLYRKVGIALSCVLANVLTGVIILGLIFAASLPATNFSFALVASIIYLGLPFTVVSNLSTSPMLDRISPKEFKTFAQGLNSACWNLANAFIPVAFGIVSDLHGYMLMLYMILGVKVLGVLVNLPLVFNPLLQGESAQKAKDEKDDDTGKSLKENVAEGTIPSISTARLSSNTEESSVKLTGIARRYSSINV